LQEIPSARLAANYYVLATLQTHTIYTQLCTHPRDTNHEGIYNSIGATQKESAQSLQNMYIYIYVLKEKARAKQNSRGSPDTTSKGRRPQIDKDTANFVRYHKAESVFSSIGIRKMFKLVVLSIHSPTQNNAELWETTERANNHQRTIHWIAGLRDCHTTLSIPG